MSQGPREMDHWILPWPQSSNPMENPALNSTPIPHLWRLCWEHAPTTEPEGMKAERSPLFYSFIPTQTVAHTNLGSS